MFPLFEFGIASIGIALSSWITLSIDLSSYLAVSLLLSSFKALINLCLAEL
jgi:hypothetical protein